MLLFLHRIAFRSTYTIGRLLVDGKYLCDTLEPSISASSHPAVKAGTYDVVCHVSRKFHGSRPMLNNVAGRAYILIHEGNSPSDTEGCILPGLNSTVGHVWNSRQFLDVILEKCKAAWKNNEPVTISIINTPSALKQYLCHE